ncbi:hypothetical protein V8F33_004765 [Rhypophila sp. PSN 637]
MWHQNPTLPAILIALVGILPHVVTPATASAIPQQSSTVHVQGRASPPSFPCNAILDIVDSYGTLEGTLGGAQILAPTLGSSEAGAIIRQFMTLLDSATTNVWALFDAVPCPRYQAPVGNEDEEIDSLAKRQSGQGNGSAVICTALARVSDDVAQTASLMTKLVQAKGLPSQLYIDPLQEAVDDAKEKIGIVVPVLALGNHC